MSKPKLNFLDRAISFMSPEMGVKRAAARELFEFSYEAANPGVSRTIDSGGFGSRSAESWQNQRDRIKMMWEARSLVKSFPFIKSILLKESMYACGRIRYQSTTGDPQIDRVYEEYWDQWSKNCDLTNRHVFRQMIQLGHMGMRCDGEYGWALQPHGPEIKLQAIEADRIGNPNQQGSNVEEDQYIQGITINELGQPVSYRIFERTRMGQYKNPQEVEPARFIHYFDPLRSDQYHGVTLFDTVLAHARDIHDLIKWEKLAVKWASAHSGVITKETKDITKWKDGDTSPEGTNYEKIEPGKILRLLPGENVSPFQTMTRPSPTFNGFIDTLVREMANGLNLPYSFVWDMAALGGVSARIELAMAQRAFKRSQNLLVEQVLDKVKDAVLSRAIAFKVIPPHRAWRKCKWQFPAHITADQGYTTQADIAMMQNGLKSASEIIAEMGGDFDETTETLAREALTNYQISQMFGTPMEMISARYPNPTQLMAMMNQQMLAEQQGEPGPAAQEEEEEVA